MDEETVRKAAMALNWEARYNKAHPESNSPEYFLEPLEELDANFKNFLINKNITDGTSLDIGTGTGEQAIFLSQYGFTVTATDISATAIAQAREKAALLNADVNFIVDNILDTVLDTSFDLIFDRGCYTLIADEYKEKYLENVKKLLKPDGWLLIKADSQPKDIPVFKNDGGLKTKIFKGKNYINMAGDDVYTVFFVIKKNEPEMGNETLS